jgi:hypothetical protein
LRAAAAGFERLGPESRYQDLALCDNLDVVANLFFGGEKLTGVTRVLDEYAMDAVPRWPAPAPSASAWPVVSAERRPQAAANS